MQATVIANIFAIVLLLIIAVALVLLGIRIWRHTAPGNKNRYEDHGREDPAKPPLSHQNN